jgi:hypothetical protein
MTKAEQFVLIVQTGAICHALTHGRSPSAAMAVVAFALEIPEDRLPDDVLDAAGEYLNLQFSTSPPGVPADVPAWLQGLGPY